MTESNGNYAIIDGRKQVYTAVAGGKLTQAKRTYRNLKYVGSSSTFYLNGKEQNKGRNEVFHFFIKVR